MLSEHTVIPAVALALACAPAPRPVPAPDPSTPVAACAEPGPSPRFDFRQSFWLNLHNFLYQQAKRRSAIADEGPGARVYTVTDTAGGRALTLAERDEWQRALIYFQDSVLRGHSRDSVVIRVNDRIAVAADNGGPGLGPEDAGLERALREAAGVYRAVWWERHERTNRRWTGTMVGFLARYLGCLAPRAAEVLRTEWPAVPLRVDASVYANWSGAYATSVAGPRITVSSNVVGNLELYGRETLVHEAAHAGRMLQPLDSALAAEATRQGVRVPRELSHLLLFYTAGALVREVVATHVPYAERFGIWRRTAPPRSCMS
jgi:hypothetical protein